MTRHPKPSELDQSLAAWRADLDLCDRELSKALTRGQGWASGRGFPAGGAEGARSSDQTSTTERAALHDDRLSIAYEEAVDSYRKVGWHLEHLARYIASVRADGKHAEEGPDACVGCKRIGTWSAVYADALCRWEWDFRQRYGVLPHENLLRKHHTERRVLQKDVDRYHSPGKKASA